MQYPLIFTFRNLLKHRFSYESNGAVTPPQQHISLMITTLGAAVACYRDVTRSCERTRRDLQGHPLLRSPKESKYWKHSQTNNPASNGSGSALSHPNITARGTASP